MPLGVQTIAPASVNGAAVSPQAKAEDLDAAADASSIRFVSRLPRTFDYERDALAQPKDAWRTLTDCAELARRLPPAQRPTFRGAEATIEMVGPDKITRRFRVLYIYGSEEAGAARASRARLLTRAEDALATIGRGLANKPRQDHERVERRVAKAVAQGRVGQWLRTEVRAHGDNNLSLRWWRDGDALIEAERRDGLYALVTNMAPRQCSADRLLTLYKDQALSERAHHFLKGPLAVRPVFLHSNRRAAALVHGLLPQVAGKQNLEGALAGAMAGRHVTFRLP